MSATPRNVRIIPITWTSDESQAINIADCRDVVLTIVGTGTASVQGSAQKEIVDFTAASTITNSYVDVVIADLGVPNTYATTLIVAGATKLGELNTNLLQWISVTRSVGTLDAFITVCDNS